MRTLIPASERPNKGQKIGRPVAATQATIIDVVNDYLRKLQGPSAGRFETLGFPSLVIDITNETGENRLAGDVLAITAATGSFPDELAEANRRPLLAGAIPSSSRDVIAILNEPMEHVSYEERVGRATVYGPAVCKVDVLDVDHKYAEPIDGDATMLRSAASGPVRVLDRVPGTGVQDAMVLLQCWDMGGEVGRWLRATSVTADANGNYPAVLLDGNGAGARTDGDTVYFKLLGGDSVVSGGKYWATLNGTATLEDVTKPLYDGTGSDRIDVKDCEDGVPGYRQWKFPHPTEASDFIPGSPP